MMCSLPLALIGLRREPIKSMRPYQDDDVGDRAHIRHAEAIIIIFQPERECMYVCVEKSPAVHYYYYWQIMYDSLGGREVQITFRESGTR